MKKNLSFWTCCDRDSFTIIRSLKEPPLHYGSWKGPYITLAEAKYEAISYYQCDLRDARTNLQEVKSFKLKDVKIDQ